MTITIRKLHLAIAVLVVALIAPSTAVALHIFDDVPDDRFFAEPVAWAAANAITTGKSPTIFDPEGNVTRGESVTFLKRYDDNIVQPALATLTTGVAANATDMGSLEAAMPFAETVFASNVLALPTVPTMVLSLPVTAPVDGQVTLNYTAILTGFANDGDDGWCVIVESGNIPADLQFGVHESQGAFEKQGLADSGSVSGTRTFDISTGTTVTYVLACEENTIANGGTVIARNLTAIFTPAP